MAQRSRRPIGAKQRLRILLRDNLKCTNCGNSPATDPEVYLEVDHRTPYSKGGSDDDTNLYTLCRLCNRGKGNDEGLNKSRDSDIINRLDRINPAIIKAMADNGSAIVVANSEEFAELIRLNRGFEGYEIVPTTNTISGFGAGASLGIYTLNDHGGSKTHFRIAPID
jgi:hypothetical protein